MIYKTYYDSPVGNILLLSKENTLIRLSIEGQKYYIDKADNKIPQKNDIEIFVQTKEWLDRYFEGKKPKISELKIDITGNEWRIVREAEHQVNFLVYLVCCVHKN